MQMAIECERGWSFQGLEDELVAAVQAVRASFPDIAPALGPILPAAGKSMTWKEVHIFRCAGGRIAEHWGVFDVLGILQQLGAIPA